MLSRRVRRRRRWWWVSEGKKQESQTATCCSLFFAVSERDGKPFVCDDNMMTQWIFANNPFFFFFTCCVQMSRVKIHSTIVGSIEISWCCFFSVCSLLLLWKEEAESSSWWSNRAMIGSDCSCERIYQMGSRYFALNLISRMWWCTHANKRGSKWWSH